MTISTVKSSKPLPDGERRDDHHLPRLSHPVPDRAGLARRQRPQRALLELRRALVRRARSPRRRRHRWPWASPWRSGPRRPSRRRWRGARLAPWLAGALLLLLAAAAIAGRNQIAARLPATAPVYQRLGLSLELPLGIEFRDLGSEQRMAAGQPVLVVTGEITNITRAAARRAADPRGPARRRSARARSRAVRPAASRRSGPAAWRGSRSSSARRRRRPATSRCRSTSSA